jgi:hypothetical protein
MRLSGQRGTADSSSRHTSLLALSTRSPFSASSQQSPLTSFIQVPSSTDKSNPIFVGFILGHFFSFCSCLIPLRCLLHSHPPISFIPSGIAWIKQGKIVNFQSEATSIAFYHTLQQGYLVSRLQGLQRLMVTCFHSPSSSGLDLHSPTIMFKHFQSNSPPRTMYGVVASSRVSQAGMLKSPECQADDSMMQPSFSCSRTICSVK